MAAAILSLLVLAVAAPLLHRMARTKAGWILALAPLAWFLYFASQIKHVAGGGVARASYLWIPTLDVNFSFFLDGLSLLFALLITGIGALVVAYSGGYLANHARLGRFYLYLLMFMASMLGLVLADNAVTLFVFWELTSLASYFLIGFDHERPAARRAALQALLVTGLGGLPLLIGLLMLGHVGGSLELSALATQGGAIRTHSLYLPILYLILVGAFTKSAQFPFHFWLPNAMEAPTPVSAYLHAATMVKGGVYLLARLSPALGGTDAWFYTVTVTGAISMLVGAYLALQHTDLKRILAYSTVSSLGTLTMLLGVGTTPATLAAALYLLAHALYKGGLFLVAGAVDHETDVGDVSQLGGLRRAMPVTATAAAMAALSMAGLPPGLGFIGKEMYLEALWKSAPGAMGLVVLSVLAGMLILAVAGIVSLEPFTGPRRHTPKAAHEAPMSLWLAPVLLGVLGLVFGLFPSLVADSLLSPAATAIHGQPSQIHLALWHGWNTLLGLSALTIAGGAGIYLARVKLRDAMARADALVSCKPSRCYDLALEGLGVLARAQTRVLQSGYLRFYMLMVIAATVLLAGYTLASREAWGAPAHGPELRPHEAVLAILILLAALAAVRSKSRLGAAAALGVVGYGVALIYIHFGAPDLAMTQVLVETLTVILFVLIFYHLPRFADLSGARARARDIFVALSAGALVTGLILAATGMPVSPRISPFFAQESLRLAHGRNIVNVILVDFRGLDTLGEITVLSVAGIGVYALLKLHLEKGVGR